MQIPLEVRTAWIYRLEDSLCLPVTGGLSSSKVWRVQPNEGQQFCLKAWPDKVINSRRLSELHQFVTALQTKLDFIPKLVPILATPPVSFVHHADYYWELVTWLDGKPLSPHEARIAHGEAAVEAVVQTHQASRAWMSTVGCSPSVATRIELLQGYRERLPVLRSLRAGTISPLDQLMQTTLGHFDRWANSLIEQLNRLRNPVELLWVVRDLHRDHMLFQETRITGIIDFGAARLDEPLIDLVRLLGSLWPLDCGLRHQLVSNYATLSGQMISLSRYGVLDHCSTLLSAMQWLQWLVVEQRSFAADQEQLLQRWKQLNDRLDYNQW